MVEDMRRTDRSPSPLRQAIFQTDKKSTLSVCEVHREDEVMGDGSRSEISRVSTHGSWAMFFLFVPGYTARRRRPAAGESCRQGGLSWWGPGVPGAGELPGADADG
ncbi:hypothetical protein KUCAC02_016370 [Chaenocephalus aceratus]|uniref:Uncharacterized protein n=1 Tax=Chaenocephalus aceratus TaxID=36190 RepID=A0ACB9Y1L0_CHAAC|nr:hypothetical protein KUCAC02_016370 [Chaenocephalus aceratus]